jgi:hypothetical protein
MCIMMYSEGPHNLDVLISFVLLFAMFSQIDIVFDDDQGFYRTLKQLIRSAKCPVVLTCNGLSSPCFGCGFMCILHAHQFSSLLFFLKICRIPSRAGRGCAHAKV